MKADWKGVAEEGAFSDTAWRAAFEQVLRHPFAPQFLALNEFNSSDRLVDGTAGECGKRRYRSRDATERAARDFEIDTGRPNGVMTIYRCDSGCPPGTYHLRNQSKKYRGVDGRHYRRLSGDLSLGSRLAPTVLAAISA
ncbi:hypothetical protein GCM10023321_72890 [Pseudonocardia eucalypti]|uniref:Uncharacterized protein n=1 Tax=Pseudonocardia eucalypti TaxID=648755 RepID=A0ABP9R871_9PSEU|nr:hypothetical protein [Pseudonocardia eucalypti]